MDLRSPEALLRREKTLPVEDPYSGHPWERQHWETSRAFAGFKHYRDQGPSRTLHQANYLYRSQFGMVTTHPDRSDGNATGSVIIWARKFRWKERIAAFEDHLDKEALKDAERELRKVRTRQAVELAGTAESLYHPVQVYRDRLAKVAAGERIDELLDLADEDLLRLLRHTVTLLPEIHKSEREVLGATSADQPGMHVSARKVQGEIIRKILGDPDMVGLMEKVSFEMTAVDAEGDQATG